MMPSLRVSLVVAIGLLLFPGLAAQSTRAPAESELWLETGVRIPVAPRTTATLTEILRWDESLARFQMAAPELLLRCKVLSWWRLDVGGRYMHKRDNDGVLQPRSRIFAATRFRVRTRPLALEVRVQWRKEFRQEYDNGTLTRQYLRSRAKLKLRTMRDVTPFISAETFHRMDNADLYMPERTLARMRYMIGAEWGQGDVEYEVRYGLEVPVHEEWEALQYIVSFGVRFDLPD